MVFRIPHADFRLSFSVDYRRLSWLACQATPSASSASRMTFAIGDLIAREECNPSAIAAAPAKAVARISPQFIASATITAPPTPPASARAYQPMFTPSRLAPAGSRTAHQEARQQRHHPYEAHGQPSAYQPRQQAQPQCRPPSPSRAASARQLKRKAPKPTASQNMRRPARSKSSPAAMDAISNSIAQAFLRQIVGYLVPFVVRRLIPYSAGCLRAFNPRDTEYTELLMWKFEDLTPGTWYLTPDTISCCNFRARYPLKAGRTTLIHF